MRVLVTGAAGFTGRVMMRLLASQQGVTPFGLVRHLVPPDPAGRCSYATADLLDRPGLETVLANVKPDAVIHLAGLTHGTPEALHETNVTGTKNLLDACIAANPDCRILVVSSSAVYGYAGENPIPETAALQPVADYGRSKVAQEAVALEYAGNGAAVAIARPFNLAGPGQPESFICGKLVHLIAVAGKTKPVLDLRETSSSRDLLDVRDVVRGYWALVSRPDFVDQCSGKTFNLGSGNAYPVSSIITMLEDLTQQQYTLHLPEKAAVPPILTQKSDNSRITSLTGWKPEIPLVQSLRDMLDAAGVKTRG
jgi:GDP-4-dehydro-6-deoxy-D-mannose reductase